MSELFMRDDAPLSKEEWEHIDHVVVHTARQFLVARRFIELVGPLGAGTEIVPVGTGEKRRYIPLQVIQHDFALVWRDIQASRKREVPLELGPAAQASAECALDEDRMILNALLDEAEHPAVPSNDWSQPHAAFASVVSATQRLVGKNFYGPYAVVVSPALYAQTLRLVEGMGRLESQLIQDVAQGGLFQSPVLEDHQGLVISLGKHNLDLVVGQDLITAYMGNDGLDHLFRVMETLALRIKRPGAIMALA